MTCSTGSFDELLEELRSIDRKRDITLDGLLGAGKTSTAIELASQLGRAHLDLDNYLTPNEADFYKAVSFEELACVSGSSREEAGIVFSGICMRWLEEGMQLSQPFRVYVKRLVDGAWDCDDYLKNDYTLNPTSNPPNWCNRYHLEKRPNERADLIFERSAS